MSDKQITSTPEKLGVASKFLFHLDSNYLRSYVQDFRSDEVILLISFFLIIFLLRFFLVIYSVQENDINWGKKKKTQIIQTEGIRQVKD